VALLGLALPAGAQGVTGTLRVQGTVMVSVDGQFVRATNGQPVTAGMQLTVGEGGSATVQFGPDCKRSYESAGTYTIAPARCDNDRKQDDRSRKEDMRQSEGEGDAGSEQGQAAGSPGSSGAAASAGAASGTASLAGQLAIIAGTVAAGAARLDREGGDSPPDQPVSR
jgi:hypothetical protein